MGGHAERGKDDFEFGIWKLKFMSRVPKIVCGGQTGADRAALDWALAQNLQCGGWCSKGRKAEGGVIDSKYPLKETWSPSYLERSEWNVRDSDGTVVFSTTPGLSGGSKKTMEFARKKNKPYLHLYPGQPDAVARLRSFVRDNAIQVLNVAGPRGSKESRIAQFVIEILDRAFGPWIPASGDKSKELQRLMAEAERDLARWEESQLEQES